MSASGNINTAAFEFYKESLAGTLPGSPTVPGTGATNLGKAEDAAHASGDVGVMALGVANATVANLVADGDYTPLATTLTGAQQISLGQLRANGADAVSNSGVFGRHTDPAGQITYTAVTPLIFNGTTWDRMRSVGSAGALAVESGPYLRGRVTADGQIKAGAGLIHTVSISALTATPTAGLLTIYDSLTETGTIIYSEWVFATVTGHSVLLDIPFATGCYVGFDATLANVACTVSYR